jgi:transcriptional regulator with XRE-family HTH domain
MRANRPETLTGQLRRLVLSRGKSRYQIAKETGIDESALSRFVNGERGVSMAVLDKLGECLGLAIVQVKKSGMGKARKPKGR